MLGFFGKQVGCLFLCLGGLAAETAFLAGEIVSISTQTLDFVVELSCFSHDVEDAGFFVFELCLDFGAKAAVLPNLFFLLEEPLIQFFHLCAAVLQVFSAGFQCLDELPALTAECLNLFIGLKFSFVQVHLPIFQESNPLELLFNAAAGGNEGIVPSGNFRFEVQDLVPELAGECLGSGDVGGRLGKSLLPLCEDLLFFFLLGFVFVELRKAESCAEFFESLGIFEVASCLAGLQFNASQLALNFIDDVRQPEEILFGPLEFSFGLFFVDFESADSCGFLKNNPAVHFRGLEQLINLTLFDDGIGTDTDACVEEHIPDVAEPAGFSIEEVFAFSASIESAGYG